MRLLQSVLSRLKQTQKPQRQFAAHLLGLLLMLPGHATLRNMSRSSPYHERTVARWYDTPFDWVSFNQVVIVVHTQRHRYAVLFSTDIDLEPLRLCRYYKARFQLELIFRDAKQLMGLSNCQARSKAKLDFHFQASLSAVTIAKLEVRQQRGNSEEPMLKAHLKRRAFNQHLLNRIVEHLANGQSLEKSSPDYEALWSYGIITKEAA